MKKIKITESALRKIVKESVKKVLKENSQYSNDGSIYGKIDSELSLLGDAHVSRFYSDEYQITLAVNKNVDRRKVIEIMNGFDYEYYTAGANDEYIMMTFKPF